jgi:AraC-like DNA-binding protein
MKVLSDFYNYAIPISVGVFKLDDVPLQLTPNHMMIITVLSGEISVTNGYLDFNYKEGEVALVSPDSPIIIRVLQKKSNVLLVGIDNTFYRNQFPNVECAVFIKSNQDALNKMLPLLLETAFALTDQIPDSYSVINDNIKSVLKIALDNCQYYSEIIKKHYSSLQTQLEYTSLMHNILQYINNNYAHKISLTDFAQLEHISENYLSHLIKKISGTTFKELIAIIRCKKSELLLRDSSKKVNEIAYLVGFSTPEYYKTSFEKLYKMTPDAYRRILFHAGYSTNLPNELSLLESKNRIREFAAKHNIILTITTERFFTIDTVYVDHVIKQFQKVLSDEGSISNIDAEMNESTHEAFVKMQKEFRMKIITLDASILLDSTASGNQLTIATNINYLIWSKFKIRFIINSLSNNIITAIVRFMKFYFRRFNETLDEIDFSIRVNSPKDALAMYKLNLSKKLREEVGPSFNIEVEPVSNPKIKYFPYLYDSFVLTPFAMDELFHPENWKIEIDFSLIDAVSENGYILAGGSGLLTWNGIKKPWWHAYNLASKLKGNIISEGLDHIITNNNGIITILTYNTCGLPPAYLQSLTTTQELFNAIQNKGHAREHAFQLINLFGKYKTITYSINETACLFSRWAGLDYPEYLTLEEETVLSQICHPDVKFGTIDSNGKIDISTKEESFGITCVVLEKK